LGALLGYVFLNTPTHGEEFFIVFLFVFMAAALWIDYSKPSRAMSLAGLCLAAMLLFLAYVTLSDPGYPKSCKGRRILFCELGNLLYLWGGSAAVASLWLAGALFVAYWSGRSLWRALRTNW
jgi:hypothetical protein